jgi:hypothetical protein
MNRCERVTTHHSPLTTHHSPLTTHHSPLTKPLQWPRCFESRLLATAMHLLWWLLIPLGIVALMGGFFVLIVGAALWEKRHIVVYALPEPGQERPPSAYAQQANAVAAQLGFQHYGTFHHGNGGIYQVRYDFWVSPDRLIILLVGGGKIAGMPADAIWLTTRLQDGRYLMTTDFSGEADLSRLLDIEIQRDVGIVFIADRHRHRVKSSAVPAVPLSEEPLGDYLQMRKRQIEQMVANGDARYVDAEQMTWKHTLKGALRFYFVTIWGIGK